MMANEFSDPLGTYYLYENNELLAKERSKSNILVSWKASHKKQPNKYHEVRFEPDVAIKGMPKRWDYCQLKPGDDLRGVPCCRAPILEWDMRGFWKCTECGQLWFELRNLDYLKGAKTEVE